MKKEGNQKNRLILFGIVLGFVLNQFATYHYVLITHPIVVPLYVLEFVLILILARMSYANTTELSKVKKAKYTFMGVSLMSFLFTIWDIIQFYVLGEHYIKMSYEPPYLWLGGVSLPSFLISLTLGAFFNFLEHFIESFE